MAVIAVGIDLGTTNSCVAVCRNGKVEILQNEENSYVMPSWVSFTDNGIVVGHEAKNEAHKYTRNTIFEVKRLIGQPFDDQEVQSDIRRFPFKVTSLNGHPLIKVNSRGRQEEYLPEEISAFILEKLKVLAELRLSQDISQAVITVPAYFNDYQRQATKNAATIAGFKKTNVINEPTAAALAFSHQNAKGYRRNVLVYDFGGGTFDVSIVAVGRGQCKVKATLGNSHLGGTDIDLNLVNFIKTDFKERFGEDIVEDEAVMRRLKSCSERIKERLSGKKRTVEVELSSLSGKDYFAFLSRNTFEDLNRDIFQRTLKITEECLKESGLHKDQIDEVILVGGSSRIPKVQEMLKEYFGDDKINKSVNPDEAVAYGAAIQANSLLGDKSEVEDVVSLSLGIAVLDHDVTADYLSNVLIPRNTSIPTTFTRQYNTSYSDQEEVSIMIHQGEALLAKDNFELGSFVLSGLTKGPAKSTKYNVCFEIDAEGILNVSASEIGACNFNSIEIDMKKKGLTPSQIAARAMEIEKHREEEQERKRFTIAKYNLETLCNRVIEETQKVGDDDFEPEIVDRCNNILKWLATVSINDQDELDQKRMEIEDVFGVITAH